MKAIDMHLHLDLSLAGGVGGAVDFLSKELAKSPHISKGLLLHLNTQNVALDELSAHLSKTKGIVAFANINPYVKNAEMELERAVKELGFKGLKLHPRLEFYSPDAPEVIALCKRAEFLKVPVLVDAFPDGHSLMNDFSVKQFGALATAVPGIPVIMAHFGGYKAIEMMLLAKRIKNIYLNVAYTLLYFRGSSITSDLVYCIKSMKGDRIFYGSDYPDRGLDETYILSKEVFDAYGLSNELQEKVFHANAEIFWGQYL